MFLKRNNNNNIQNNFNKNAVGRPLCWSIQHLFQKTIVWKIYGYHSINVSTLHFDTLNVSCTFTTATESLESCYMNYSICGEYF